MTKTLRAGLLGLALASTALTALPASAETTLRLITGWSPNVSYVSGILPGFEAAVTEATGGEVVFQQSGPEVVPPFEQLQPLSAGVFDLMYSTAAYHQAQTGVASIVDGLLVADPEAIRASGVFAHIATYYRDTFGVELLAMIPAPANQIILREPLAGDSLEGLRIRTNAAFEGMVRQLGGEPVSMSPADAYAAMERGVLDGIAFPIHAAADFRLYEVGHYMTRPGFGRSGIVLMANAARFDSLPEETRTVIHDAALEMERAGTAFMTGLGQSQEQIMLDNGVEIVEFSPELAARIHEMFVEGTLAIARRSAPEAVDEVVGAAREAGVLDD